jgi:oxygen-independent coproporphyrinogen III oxidase
MNMEDYGIYLHIPFCRRRCAYCDFFSTEGQMRRIAGYVRALTFEIGQIGTDAGRPLGTSVFFGGGTPSLLAPNQAAAVLQAVRKSFRLTPDVEISLEANPGTLDAVRLEGFLEAGINRLSLGIQSLDDAELHLLGRIHTAEDAERTYADARRAGFYNISLDLIFGLPGQTPAAWERTLDRALDLAPEHFSLYALTLERGTPLARAVRRGALPAPDDDAAAEMYECAERKLAAAGYRQYEISNWARDRAAASPAAPDAGCEARPARFPRYACRHNLRYWLNRPYLGFGAGAHGCAAGKRYANVCSVEKYIARMRAGRARRFPLGPAATRTTKRTRDGEMRETMWLGLRLTEAGVDRESYRRRFEADYGDVFRTEIESAVRDGLLEWGERGEFIRLTERGRLLGNRVFRLFVE